MLSEISQTKTNINTTYMWNLKKIIQMYLYIKQKHTGIEDKLAATKGEGGTNEEYGINRYELLNIKWISNKDL